MSRNTCNSENGEKSPEGWRFKLDVKSGPLESGDFGKNDKFGCRECREKSPEGWRFKLDGKSGPLKRGALAILAKKTNLAKNGKKPPGPLASGDFREIGDFGENGKIL